MFGADEIGLVDVGGDVLTVGAGPGIRSPLADLLALAACVTTGRPCRLLVAAPGVDGELAESTVLKSLENLGAQSVAALSIEAFRPVLDVFRWHPSEASALVAAAAQGIRGSVEVRDSGQRVHLTDNTPAVFAVDALKAAAHSPAAALLSTTTLAEAAKIVKCLTGVGRDLAEVVVPAREGIDDHADPDAERSARQLLDAAPRPLPPTLATWHGRDATPVLCHEPCHDEDLRTTFVLVGPVGLEPTTRGLKVRCSAN